MPAGLPGSSAVQNAANPNAGRCVIFDLLSGPKGSPFDKAGSAASSTGGLNTGIGFGSPPILGVGLVRQNFNDEYTPGVTLPNGTASSNSTLMYIGGGKSDVAGLPVPYTAGFGIGQAGNGGSRDAGAGPAFTGFLTKSVIAVGDVANGAVVETGWVNRSGVTITVGQTVFGSSTAASAAPA